MNDTKQGETELRSLPADIGAGDPEAPAGAIPNLIAGLVETETWRNAATVLMGVLLIGLGYWAYTGVRTALARHARREPRGAARDRRQGARRLGRRHMCRSRNALARDPRCRRAGGAACRRARGDPAAAAGALHAGGRGPERRGPVVDSSTSRWRCSASSTAAASCSPSKDPLRCGQRMRSGVFRERLDLAFDGKPQFVRPYPDPRTVCREADGRRATSGGLVPRADRVGAAPPVAVLAMGVADRPRTRDDLLGGATRRDRGGLRVRRRRPDADARAATARQLAAAGAMPGERAGDGACTIHVRDPGGELVAGSPPTLEPAARPLDRRPRRWRSPRAARPLTTDRVASIATPYRDYRGTEVVGAWQWLPAYDFGVVAEISGERGVLDAALPLTISFSVIGGIHRADAGGRVHVGVPAGTPQPAVRARAAAGRVHARPADQRRRHGDDLPGAACAAQASDRDQDPEEAHRDRRVRAPLRARGAAGEPADASRTRSRSTTSGARARASRTT